MTSKLIQSEWREFSNNFISFQKLPFGTELRLYDASGRKKRTDLLVKRRRISQKTMKRAENDDTVTSLLNLAAEILSTDLRARKLRMELFGPNRERINGNKHVGTVRKMEPLPTDDDIEMMEIAEADISEIKAIAMASIIESEYLIDEPYKTVCSAYIRALIERYGRPAVLNALGR